VIEEFKNIFGPELEAVTGDPKRIEEVLVRVDNLVKPLEDVSNGGCHVKVWKV
jgi:dynein heavy chain